MYPHKAGKSERALYGSFIRTLTSIMTTASSRPSHFHCRGVNKVILNWQRPLWEGDREVVRSSGRNEPMLVVIYMCMKAMLEISLYSYLCLKLAKMLCLSYYLLCFLFNKIGEVSRTCSA
jgi:hypothetical protein